MRVERLKLIAVTLLITLYTIPSYSNITTGLVIEDKAPYPLYQYSQLIQNDELPSLLLKNDPSDIYTLMTTMLDNMGVPFTRTSDSPVTIQTDWIAWHYDTRSKKTLSSQTNRFFKLNLRDKYKFKLSINNIEQHPAITLAAVDREQEVDITPDTEMVWLKWKPIKPDNNAINAFMQRLQTEYEIQMLTSNSPVSPVKNNTSQSSSNHTALNMNVEKAWSTLIRQLSEKSVPLANTHDGQHMLNTEWVYAKYEPKTNSFNFSANESQRHQFQLLVVPGSSGNSSSIFAYHTGFQQKQGDSAWTNSKTQENIAAAFLGFLNPGQ